MRLADVAPGGLPRVEVTAAQHAQYEQQCDALVQRTLAAHDRFHGGGHAHEWKLLRQKRSLRIYRQREREAPDSAEVPWLLCSGLVPGTVDDMLHGACVDSSEGLRVAMNLLLAGKVVDAALLHVFESQAPVLSSGLQWLALKSPTASALIHDRDLLVFKRLGRLVDHRGRRFAYVATQSVDVGEWPAQRRFERAYVSQCVLFRQVQDAWLGCFCLGSASMRGALPRQLNELLTAENLLQVGNLFAVAQAKAFSALAAASADRLAAPSHACEVCMRTKQLTGRRLCMGCRRQVCRKCSDKRPVFRLQVRSQQPAKEVFCVQCVAHVTRPKAAACAGPDAELHGSGSGWAWTDKRSQQSGLQTPSPSPSSTPSPASELDVWLPMPEAELPADLHGLARFVESARAPHADDWNAQELAYLEGLLRDPPASCSDGSDGSEASGASGARRFHAGASLPSRETGERDEARERLTRSQGAARQELFFSVDDLD